MLKVQSYLAFKLSDVVFIRLLNVKMKTYVGILTFMSVINSKLLFTKYALTEQV